MPPRLRNARGRGSTPTTPPVPGHRDRDSETLSTPVSPEDTYMVSRHSEASGGSDHTSVSSASGDSVSSVISDMLSLKLDGVVKPYRRRVDDFDMFWSKSEVLVDISGWTNAEQQMKRLPLFLGGEALVLSEAT
eukprot:scpid85839/ scgid9407/ 